MAKGLYHEWLTDDGLLMLSAWARDGLTDEQIAHNMGVNVATLYKWKRLYPQIDEALKRTKAMVDAEVENALLKRALGYKYTEITRERKMNQATGEMELVVTKEIVKEVPPETVAQIFWLKNRKTKEWRDKREEAVEITGDINGTVEIPARLPEVANE